MFDLPAFPLLAFFALLTGGYFVAFTAVGGQSIGKMALGIKVVSEEEMPTDTDVPPLTDMTTKTGEEPPKKFYADNGWVEIAAHRRIAHAERGTSRNRQ